MNIDLILLPEIRKRHEEMRLAERALSKEEKAGKHAIFGECAWKIIELSNIARKEGILSLEDVDIDMGCKQCSLALKNICTLIVEGTEPEVVERNAMMRYFSAEHDSYQGLVHIMLIYGMLGIQAGENPRLIMDMLQSMVPDDVSLEAYENERNMKEASKTQEQTGNEGTVSEETLFSGDIRLKVNQAGYFELYLCDKLLQEMSNRAIQRVLREEPDTYFCDLMQGLSGAGRKCILSNISKRKAEEWRSFSGKALDVNECIEDDWTARKVENAAARILRTIYKLEGRGEIVIASDSKVRYLSTIIRYLDGKKRDREDSIKDCDFMIRMLEGYKNNL